MKMNVYCVDDDSRGITAYATTDESKAEEYAKENEYPEYCISVLTVDVFDMAISSLDVLEEIRQEMQAIKAYEVPTDGEVHVNSCKNKTGLKVKMEALAIIDKYLQEMQNENID